MRTITSRQNPFIKSVRALHDGRLRREKGLILLEGVRLLEEALAAGITLETVLVCPELISSDRARALLNAVESADGELIAVTPSVLAAAAETESPQGFLAVARSPSPPDPLAVLASSDLLVLGDGIQDPGNAGTLIRTAEAAGAGGIFFTCGSVYAYSGKVLRASMGSIFRLPVGVVTDGGVELVSACCKQGWEVLVTTPLGGVPFWQVDLTKRTLVVLGNEGAGISAALLDRGTRRVYIPLEDPVESLNVAVAGGIILYEAVRQRFCPPGAPVHSCKS